MSIVIDFEFTSFPFLAFATFTPLNSFHFLSFLSLIMSLQHRYVKYVAKALLGTAIVGFGVYRNVYVEPMIVQDPDLWASRTTNFWLFNRTTLLIDSPSICFRASFYTWKRIQILDIHNEITGDYRVFLVDRIMKAFNGS